MDLLKLREFVEVESNSGSGSGDGDGSGDGSGYGYGYGDGYGDGSGDGSGYGYGDGDGYGYGDDYGSGYGYGDDYGSGYGDGYGDGSGYGYGYGYGYGDGYGDGSGDGYGYGLKSINGEIISMIDNIQTIIRQIKGNIAKGVILNKDFTTKKCYIVKDGNLFAHGKTLKEAMQALAEKKWKNLDTDEIIEKFCKKFEKGKSYKGTEFFEWHHYLTGSCLMGRESFVKNHNLNLDSEFTVEEFIELTEDDYGGDIIKELKEKWRSV